MEQPKTEVIGQRKTNWWLVVGGIVLILFAIAAFAAPFLFLEFVAVWVGVGFLFGGIMGIVTYVQSRYIPGSGWSLFMAILDVVVGILMMLHPVAFAPVFPWLLGLFFIVFGVLQIAGTVPFGALIPESRIIMVISGILTVVVGIMFIVWPSSLSIWVAAFALIRGITLIVGGFTSHIE